MTTQANGGMWAVGIGPGCPNGMTLQARDALQAAEVIYGYETYLALVRPLWPQKRYVGTAMRKEIERCRAALQEARAGRRVAMVCSGDAGVYGMAGLLYELMQAEGQVLPLHCVAGVTAAQSGAALLGAPLMQDYCVISLSDLLIDRAVIERRLHGAGAGDFAVVLYNAGSKKRIDCLRRACDILLQYRGGDTVCGVAQNIGRAGETARLLPLSQLRETAVDMGSTVFVGSSTTRVIAGRMVTPRGYEVRQ